ncbi:MAG: DUF4388 domain-containing protein, partial [Acidobacteriota bacterium]
EDRLGQVLLKTGKISPADLDQVLKIQRETGQRLGDLLIATANLTDEDVCRALQLQVTQILYRLFRWPRGNFRFSQSTSVEYDRRHFRPIPVENILMEGLRILDEWPLIEKQIPSLEMVFSRTDPSRVVRTEEDGSPGPEPLSDENRLAPDSPEEGLEESQGDDMVTVSANEATTYHLLDSVRSVQEVIDASDLGEFETCKAIFQLLEKDLVAESRIRKDTKQPLEKTGGKQDRAMATAVMVLATAVILAGLDLGPWHQVEHLLAPVRLAGPVKALQLAASQTRLAHLDYLVRLYALAKEDFPRSLQDLAEAGLAGEDDFRDPWGQPYRYLKARRNYQIRGLDSEGKERPDLIRTGIIVLRRTGSRENNTPRAGLDPVLQAGP